MNSRACSWMVLCALTTLLAGGLVGAGIVANFDGGNGSAVVDAYAGKAGDGWAGAWQESTSSASFGATPTVVSTTPLFTGGGNYVTAAVTTSGSNKQGAFAREYEAYEGVALSAPHTIQFKIRPEDLTGFSHSEDRVQAPAMSM